MPGRIICLLSFACFILSLLAVDVSVAAPTKEEREAVSAITDAINEAADLYKERKFRETANAIKQIQTDMEELAAGGSRDVLRLLEPQFNRLKTAHRLLELEGYKLPELKELKAATPDKPETPTTTPKPDTPAPSDPDGISFTRQVATVLVNRCGKCHVDKASGKFSLATYTELMNGHPENGIVIFPGAPQASRLVQLVADKEMPPNGTGIPDSELELLTKWVAEGAKFDGKNKDMRLNLFASATPEPALVDTPTVEVTAPTGKETVSFALDVAPVLVANCNGCHFNAQRVQGGLNFTSFEGLIRGGDSGAVLKPGDGAGSNLVQRIKGEGGDRMPLRRPPLPDDVIAKIQTWIDEGARFDGGDAKDALDKVAALAKAQMSTHEQLSADRAAKAQSDWQVAMPGIAPQKVETENFLVVGNIGENAMTEFAELAETVAPKVANIFRAPSNQPLVKGRITLFLFQQRYDYSEFGTMVEKRELPQEWRGHWRYSVIDAYGAFIPPRTDEYSTEALIGQQIAGTYIASLGKMPPHWFAEGAARVAALRLAKDDPRVREWNDRLPDVLGQMKSADDFITGKLPPEMADIASFSFVDYLMDDAKRFNGLLSALRDGADFDKAFSESYGGSPAQIAGVWAQRAARRR